MCRGGELNILRVELWFNGVTDIKTERYKEIWETLNLKF